MENLVCNFLGTAHATLSAATQCRSYALSPFGVDRVTTTGQLPLVDVDLGLCEPRSIWRIRAPHAARLLLQIASCRVAFAYALGGSAQLWSVRRAGRCICIFKADAPGDVGRDAERAAMTPRVHRRWNARLDAEKMRGGDAGRDGSEMQGKDAGRDAPLAAQPMTMPINRQNRRSTVWESHRISTINTASFSPSR